MKTDWLKDVRGEEDRELRRKLVKASAPVLKVMQAIIEDKLAELSVKRASLSSYESSTWPYMQADLNAQERTYRYILSLLDQEEQA